MFLIGKIDFRNKSFSDGYLGPFDLKFTLPRRLRKRAMLKLRYFGFLKCYHTEENLIEPFDPNDPSSLNNHAWRYSPEGVKMRVKANGEDVMGDNISIEYEKINDIDPRKITTDNDLTFNRTIGSINGEFDTIGVANDNSNFGRFLWLNVGHNSLYDMNLGYLEENASEIELIFNLVRDKTADFHGHTPHPFSNSDKVRMSSITVKLELIE